MDTLRIILTIVQVISAILLTLVVTFQTGKEEGLSSAIGGGSDSYFGKNGGNTLDAKLARATKWIAALFLVMTLAVVILQATAHSH